MLNEITLISPSTPEALFLVLMLGFGDSAFKVLQMQLDLKMIKIKQRVKEGQG